MAKKYRYAKTFQNRNRPEMLSDRLGYPPERGDAEWLKVKQHWQKLPNNTWQTQIF